MVHFFARHKMYSNGENFKVYSHKHQRLRVRLGLRQIATLRLWDVASNVKNGYRTHFLRLTQITN